MISFEQAVRSYNQSHPGFGAAHVKPGEAELEYQIAKALEYANSCEDSPEFKAGRGYVHRVLAEVAIPAPAAAELFQTAILENPACRPLVKSMEFMLASVAARSPETWDHILRHTALTMRLYQDEHGEITFQNRAEALNVMVGALMHDAGKLGIDPALLHKRTRLDPERFEALLAQFAQKTSDYPQKAHDLRFLKEAQEGRLIFASGPIGESSEEVVDWSHAARRGEDHWVDEDGRARYSRILARICDKAVEAGIVDWLSEQELLTLASPVRGTLAPHERETINRHDAMSALYLSLQTLPSELHALPEMVDMDSFRTGSPATAAKKMIHLADVFEALTAKRSYKDAYTVSEALQTMHSMAEKGEIDKDQVQRFINSDLWYDYAQHYGLALGDLKAVEPLKQISEGRPRWTNVVTQPAAMGHEVSASL